MAQLTTRSVVPLDDVPEVLEGELVDMTKEDLQAEAFLLSCKGITQTEIARRMGLSRATVQRYIQTFAEQRRTHAEDTDLELEKLIGRIEAITLQAWNKHEAAEVKSLAGSNYLRLALDGVLQIAKLRGFDTVSLRRQGANDGNGEHRVIVTIGGPDGRTTQVGVSSS